MLRPRRCQGHCCWNDRERKIRPPSNSRQRAGARADRSSTGELRAVSKRSLPLLFGLLLSLGASAQTQDMSEDDFDLQIAFERALEARDSGDLETAIDRFRALIAAHPELSRARLELAVTYALALRFEQAREEAQAVLADPNTPPDVHPEINAFLEQLHTAARSSVFTPYLSIGALSDSNVNAGPEQDANGLPTGRDDVGAVVSAGMAHRYIVPGTVDLAGREYKLLWSSRAGAYSVSYDQERSYDLDVVTLVTGPSLVAADGDRVQARLQADRMWLGGEPYADYLTLAPGITLRDPASGRNGTIEVELQSRDFIRDVDRGRDATVRALAAGVGTEVMERRLALSGKARVFDEQADDDQFGRDGRGLQLTAEYTLSARTTLIARALREWAENDAVEPASGLMRSETLDRYTLAASHALADGTLGGWTADLSYVHTDNQSSVAAYDYSRNQVMVSLRREF